MLTNLNNQIFGILNTLVGTSKPLAAAYSYSTANSTSYPYAFPVWIGAEENILTNAQNRTFYNFIVRIVILDKGTKDTYDQLLSTSEQVLAELRKLEHSSLGGNAINMLVSPNIDVKWTSDGETKLIAVDITLRIDTLQSI